MTVRELAAAGLGRASAMASAQGVSVPPLRGKLLRPQTALAFVPPGREGRLDDRFWLGCLAVQMAHEASLQHDDVIDGGHGRRERKTLVARSGRGAALLAGDLYLAGSYRAARMAGSDGFLDDYLTAVEATVQGESMQAGLNADAGLPRYEAAIRAKSGALFGAAAALPSHVDAGAPRGPAPVQAAGLRALGAELGALYQMVDDLLDYCPSAKTGKPKLQDFRNRVWTFVLDGAGPDWFDQSPDQATARFFLAAEGASLAARALRRIGERRARIETELSGAGARPELIAMIRGWEERCRSAVRADSRAPDASPGLDSAPGMGRGAVAQAYQSVRRPRPAPRLVAAPPSVAALVASRALALGPPGEWRRFFARNSRSFSFASMLFPAEQRRVVRGIYAFCRFTDDLVDGSGDDAPRLHAALDAWTGIAHAAYEGKATGVPLADVVMGDAARMRVPFALALQLVEGVRMDVEPRSYANMEELRRYTHRVASVVGAWMTQALGVRDSWVVERAHELGHAMQLTNIVRDVGEDLGRGRIYLPVDLMERHGVRTEWLQREREKLRAGLAPPVQGSSSDAGADWARYAALLEDLMATADDSYEAAYGAMPALPAGFRRAVAVAAQVYRGIHDRLRANGYDNLARRAHTSLPGKVALGRQGLARLRVVRGRPELAGAR